MKKEQRFQQMVLEQVLTPMQKKKKKKSKHGPYNFHKINLSESYISI